MTMTGETKENEINRQRKKKKILDVSDSKFIIQKQLIIKPAFAISGHQLKHVH